VVAGILPAVKPGFQPGANASSSCFTGKSERMPENPPIFSGWQDAATIKVRVWQFRLILARFDMPQEKRRRAAALQDAMRGTMIPEKREASWSAPALWRFA